jgi:hypothetical protein
MAEAPTDRVTAAERNYHKYQRNEEAQNLIVDNAPE